MNPTVLDELFAQKANGALSTLPVRTTGEDHVYLVAGTPFEQYRDFLLKELPDNSADRLTRIAEDWQQASLHLAELRLTEPAWADEPTVLPLPAELEPLAEVIGSGPIFQQAFKLPVSFGMVELDRLVVRRLCGLSQHAHDCCEPPDERRAPIRRQHRQGRHSI